MGKSWYDETTTKSGKTVRGAAAMNVKVAELGGMDTIMREKDRKAAEAIAVGIETGINHFVASMQDDSTPPRVAAKPGLRLVRKAA